MSTEAMKWARAQRFGSMTLKAVVNSIAARADKTGATWVSQKTIADDTGATDRHVRGILVQLEVLGIITRTSRSAGRQGRLSDMIALAMHRSFDLSARDVRKMRDRLLLERSKRNMLSASSHEFQPEQNVVATGTRVPGNIKGATYPSQGEKIPTSQDVALQQNPPRLKVVGGRAMEVEEGQ